MDLKSNHISPVLTDPAPLGKSRLGVHSSLLSYSPPGTAFPADLLLTIPRRKNAFLDDVRSSSWLDAMKSSSPPHRKITKDVNNDSAATEYDIAYRTWMVIIISFLMCCISLMFWQPSKQVFYAVVHICLILQVKYPSALTSFEQISNYAKGKRIALFLDYDGTLSPIVDNPDCAFMSDAVRISRLCKALPFLLLLQLLGCS